MARDAHDERDQFRLLVESVVDYAIFLLDPKGTVMSWNAGAERIKGYTAQEIIGRHFSTFYQPADVEAGVPRKALETATREGRYEAEGWRVRKDGSRFWANVILTALRNRQGELVGFAKVTRDLTERQRIDQHRQVLQAITETALVHLALDDLLQAVVDQIAEQLHVDTAVVLLMSDDGRTLTARAAHGLEEEVERGVRIPVGEGFAGRIARAGTPLVIDDLEHANVLNPILREKGLRALLGVPLRARGKVVGILHVGSFHANRFGADDVEALALIGDRIAVAVENAALLQAARNAEHQAEEAEVALRVRDEFLSVAAHELRTPLTAAKAATQLLTRSFKETPLTPTQARALDTVDKQISKLARLSNQLLDTVRLESGRLALELEDVDLVDVVRSAAQQANAVTAGGHVFNIDAPRELRIRGDALRLEQVLLNLLDNAVKFSPNGGSIDITLRRSASTAVITVRDHGVGVAREHLARLFDQFFQAHPNRSGLGLGLYISRSIVERHGGTMYAEAPDGPGTRFVISLPLHASAATGHLESGAQDRTA